MLKKLGCNSSRLINHNKAGSTVDCASHGLQFVIVTYAIAAIAILAPGRSFKRDTAYKIATKFKCDPKCV